MITRLLLCLGLIASIASADPVRLKIHGHGIKTAELTESDLQRYARLKVTTVDSQTQIKHTYQGISLRELLLLNGMPIGGARRDEAEQLSVRFSAPNGKTAVYTLKEFDAAFSKRNFILAETIDGQPLPEKNGPLQLVGSGDTSDERWVSSVNDIELFASDPAP
jgi:hypothetical protein